MFSVDVKHFFKVLFKAFVIAPFMERDSYLPAFIVIAAHSGPAVPAPLLAHYLGLPALFAPFVAHCGRIR